MNKNPKEKGITLMTLVITIIVLLILASIATYSGLTTIDTVKKTTFISDLEMIQAKVNTIYEKRKLSQQEKEYYDALGQEIQVVPQEIIKKILGDRTAEGFRYFATENLKQLEMENIKQELMINFDTREVFSIIGIEIKGNYYYSLSTLPEYKGFNVQQQEQPKQEIRFTTKVTKLDNNWRISIEDITYAGNIEILKSSYKLHEDTNWILNGTQKVVEVAKPGLYDIRLQDKEGNDVVVQQYIYTQDQVLAFYDAQNNTKEGHNSSIQYWEDLTGKSQNATVTGIATNLAPYGWQEKALYIDGEDDKVTFPVSIPEQETMSIEMVFTSYVNGNTGILAADNGWKGFNSHTYNNDGSIYIGGNYTAGKEPNRFSPTELKTKIQLNKLTSLVYTYNGTTKEATVYGNGIKLASKIYPSGPEAIRYFGISPPTKNLYHRITFYDKVLTQDEVKTNFTIDADRFGI